MIHPSKIIKELGLAPLKSFGQNFQVDTQIIAKWAEKFSPAEGVIEIGPGLGAWTEVFYKHGNPLWLIEKDRALVERLRTLYKDDSSVRITENDVLETDFFPMAQAGFKNIIGNLPFYITSEILLKVIQRETWIEKALLGIQYEVAERIVSARGSSLAIALNLHGKITLCGKISRQSFYPVPNVDVGLIYFERSEAPERPYMRTLLKAAFWGKRKKLKTAMLQNPFFNEAIESKNWVESIKTCDNPKILELFDKRADALSVSDFALIYDWLNPNSSHS